ncbi:hypothetical protein DLNHIDIE_01578 [Acidithiobacillus thiooxidans ATCC 19377]|uniref:Uncharacterized protein n=1 Tax=Acidithiobacillus thiooxidans ATCC 19377 TaxID=637390 RepID=A0A543Q5V4_ACITH|nr:hypothetical protein DLNHIDIE_01578 [Acidithiobacillus thiooxidans ATCC 19377]
MLGRVSAGAGGDGAKAGTAGDAAADVTAAGMREIVDGAAGATRLVGAGRGVRTGTLTSRGGLGDSLGGAGTGLGAIGTVVRGDGGWGLGCGVAPGCGQETSWTAMGGVITGLGRGVGRNHRAKTARMPDSRIRASRKTTALGGCELAGNGSVLTAAPHG